MATPAAIPKVAAPDNDEDDDLWDFSTPGGVRTPERSPERSPGQPDDLRMLPLAKRQKLARLARRRPKAAELGLREATITLSDSDSDLEVVEEVKKATKRRNDSDILDCLENCEAVLPAMERKFSQRDKLTYQALERNRKTLEQVKRIIDAIDAPLPEQPDDMEQEQGNRSPQAEDDMDAAQAEEEKVVVKMSTKQQAEPLKMRIGRRAPLSKMFTAFQRLASRRGWVSPTVQLRFVFDGDTLGPDDTADGLDIEDDCVIEVHW